GGVALVDRFEEERGVLPFEGLEADLVEDEQVGPQEGGVQDVQAVLLARCPGLVHEVVEGEEVDAVPVLYGFEGQPDGDVRLADAGGSEDEHILALPEEAQRGELLDGRLGNAGLGVVVELSERLLGGDAAELEVGSQAPLEAGGELGGEELVKEPGGASLLARGFLEQGVELGEGGV